MSASVRQRAPQRHRLEIVGLRARGIAPLEHAGVLEGLLAAIEGPHLQTGHPPHDVARDQPEVTRPAQETGHEHHYPLRLAGAELLHEHAVVLRRARSRRALDPHVWGRGRRRGDQEGAEHEGGCEVSQADHPR